MTTQHLLHQQATLLSAIATPRISDATDLIAACAYFTLPTGIFTTQSMQQRGLQAYRANVHALAARALQTPYPVTQQLLGVEAFAMLARDLWQAHPPVRGDLAQWGGALANWMGQAGDLTAILSDYPYLCDVARIEWALHQCSATADAMLDAASFVLLTSQEPFQVQLLVAPGSRALHSAWPAASIVLAHGAGSTEPPSAHSLQHISNQLRTLMLQNRPESALVWRPSYAPHVRVLADDEVGFVAAVLAGQNLQAALGAADAGFDFSAWLTDNVQNGLVIGAAATPPCVPAPGQQPATSATG